MKSLLLKMFIIALLSVAALPQSVFASSQNPRVSYLSFEEVEKLLTEEEYDKVMLDAVKQIRTSHPELALSIGYGLCLNLPQTSVLSIAGNNRLDIPENCFGLTFQAMNKIDMREKAIKTILTDSPLIDGANGAANLNIKGKEIKVPICMESFQFGGPL